MPNGTFVHEARIRVRYAETDQMGVAYHSNHLIWMEIGRVEYCREIGIRYKDMEETGGIFLAVIEVHCRYRHPAHYDEEILVRTRVEKLGSRSMQFAYELVRADDHHPVAEGHTRHVFCDRAMRPVHLPPHYRSLFRRGLGNGEQHTQVG
jgi:acyl-CoA thioester hydrolase